MITKQLIRYFPIGHYIFSIVNDTIITKEVY